MECTTLEVEGSNKEDDIGKLGIRLWIRIC